MKFFTFKTCATLLAMFLLSVGYAQTISGTLKDASGDVVNGAKIRAGNSIEFVRLDGTFEIKNLAPGHYNLTLTAAGYNPLNTSADVKAGETTFLDLVISGSEHEIENVNLVSLKESDRKNQKQERNADQLMNVISSKNIQLMPDITVANVMQRISGVTIDRNASG